MQRSQTETASSRTVARGSRVHEGAAAERQHQRIAGEQPADHPALAVAEVALAVAGEQLGDGAAGRQLDLGVGVAERQAEPGRQPPADRGLAGAHQPDQHDAAAGQRVGQRNGLLRARCCVSWRRTLAHAAAAKAKPPPNSSEPCDAMIRIFLIVVAAGLVLLGGRAW